MMKSIWETGVKMPTFPKLTEDIKTDTLIIGGGIAGILTAYFLARQGVPYVLVEAERIAGKTTKNTTAKITYQHGLLYAKAVKNHGADAAHGVLEANKEAFDQYGLLCRDIDCDYEIKDNFVYTVEDKAALEEELRALTRIGYKARFYESLPLPIDISGAVSFPQQAQFHPLKFISKIADGLNIYESTRVLSTDGNRAITASATIRAERIITCTHFPMGRISGAFYLKLYQHRSYVTALKNAAHVDGMYVDNSSFGLSFRNYGDLLLIGGGSHRTGANGGAWDELSRFAKKHYPEATEVCRWAAQDCMSLDMLPYIGKYSNRTNILYTATGFNKWGMTGAMLSAKLLSDEIVGAKNDYASLFDPSRRMIKSKLLLNCLESAKNLLTPTVKRCPHLGCALKYNRAEHSWDCPCHGSRFGEAGTLLENPSNKNIKAPGQ